MRHKYIFFNGLEYKEKNRCMLSVQLNKLKYRALSRRGSIQGYFLMAVYRPLARMLRRDIMNTKLNRRINNKLIT